MIDDLRIRMSRLAGAGIVAFLALATQTCKRHASGDAARPVPARSPAEAQSGEPRPENTRLTDPNITRAVRREIRRDASIRAGDLGVVTRDGIVSLTGTVDNALAKVRAARHAGVVKGVRSVSNRIEVVPPRRSDAQLVSDVRRALLLDPAADSFEVEVTANDGIVRLTGRVDSWQEKQLAERVALGVRGVVEVRNELAVAYAGDRTDAEVQKDVLGRLRWDVLVDHGLVHVGVEDGKVRLTGVVGSAAEKSRAYFDAWVRGVREVDASGLRVKWWARTAALRKGKYITKSDTEVASAIRDALAYDPRVSSFGIEPRVTDGSAILLGAVTSRKAKRIAEELARNTVGVTNVDNRLRVETTPAILDSTIRSSAEAALIVSPHNELHEIDTRVDDGVVTLTGTVDSYFEKIAAEDAVSGVLGVEAVHNELVVSRPRASSYAAYRYLYPYHPYVWSRYTPPVSEVGDSELAESVEEEMYWSPFVDANDIAIVAEDGKVTLTGTVDTWHERASATDNAYEAGASAVDNRLTVR